MMTLKQKLEIIQLHMQEHSNRNIAKMLGIDKKTVNKYVAEFEQAQAVITQSENCDQEEIRQVSQRVCETPKYKKRNSPPRKWNVQMDEFLDDILAKEDEKAVRLRTKKQQLKKYQIYELMREEGFDIGYTSVCKKINEKRNVKKEAFIAQKYEFGQRFEFDFGEVRLEIGGRLTKAYLAVMSAPASGYRYARIYPNQKFDVFIDAQVRFFEHMGGCFEEGVYDNMRNVVKKFIGRNGKELNDGLMKFALYYGFIINVTNCYSGNEKGTVERSVEVVRSAAFSRNWKFDTLTDAQVALDEALAKVNAGVELDKEKAALTPYRPPYENADIVADVLVDKYSCVRYNKVSYSVPDCFVGKKMCVKAYPSEIVIIHRGKEVARHARSFEVGSMVFEITHFLSSFKRKPGALANSKALAANADLHEMFTREYKDNPREFIEILSEHKDETLEEALFALGAHRKHASLQERLQTCDPIAQKAQEQISLIGAIRKAA